MNLFAVTVSWSEGEPSAGKYRLDALLKTVRLLRQSGATVHLDLPLVSIRSRDVPADLATVRVRRPSALGAPRALPGCARARASRRLHDLARIRGGLLFCDAPGRAPGVSPALRRDGRVPPEEGPGPPGRRHDRRSAREPGPRRRRRAPPGQPRPLLSLCAVRAREPVRAPAAGIARARLEAARRFRRRPADRLSGSELLLRRRERVEPGAAGGVHPASAPLAPGLGRPDDSLRALRGPEGRSRDGERPRRPPPRGRRRFSPGADCRRAAGIRSRRGASGRRTSGQPRSRPDERVRIRARCRRRSTWSVSSWKGSTSTRRRRASCRFSSCGSARRASGSRGSSRSRVSAACMARGRLGERFRRAAEEARRRRQRHPSRDVRLWRARLDGGVGGARRARGLTAPSRATTPFSSTRWTARPTSTSTGRSARSSRSAAGRAAVPGGLLRAGTEQVAAGYILFGPAMLLVYTARRRGAPLHARPLDRRIPPDVARGPDACARPGLRRQRGAFRRMACRRPRVRRLSERA